jgi:hypothetical protein
MDFIKKSPVVLMEQNVEQALEKTTIVCTNDE